MSGPDVPDPNDDLRVERPSRWLPTWLVAVVLIVLGLAFLWNVARRPPGVAPASQYKSERRPAYSPSDAPLSVPALEIPSPPPPPPPPPPPKPEIRIVQAPPPPPIIRYVDRPAAPPPAPSNPNLTNRLSEPALATDLSIAPGASPGASGDEAPVEAVYLHNRSTLVPQGTLIPAVIESSIDSSRPGPVRAVTSGDTRGFDGSRIVIPKGTRLIGEVQGDAKGGRAMINWNRLIRPDGVAIRLKSPSVDNIGEGGVAGHVDNHLPARLSAAALQTALTVGAALATRPGSGSVVIGLPAQNAANTLQVAGPVGDNAPTVHVKPGVAIMIFVVHDLDFSSVMVRP